MGSNGNLKPFLDQGEQKDVKSLLNRLGFHHHKSQNQIESLAKVTQASFNVPSQSVRNGTAAQTIRPRYILPNLHDKTYFKAANEYRMIDKNTNRSLNDAKNREIEKQLEDAHYKMILGQFKDFDENKKIDDHPMNINNTFAAFTEVKNSNGGDKNEIDLEAVKIRLK